MKYEIEIDGRTIQKGDTIEYVCIDGGKYKGVFHFATKAPDDVEYLRFYRHWMWIKNGYKELWILHKNIGYIQSILSVSDDSDVELI